MEVTQLAVLGRARHDLQIRQIPHGLEVAAYDEQVDHEVVLFRGLPDCVVHDVEHAMTLGTWTSAPAAAAETGTTYAALDGDAQAICMNVARRHGTLHTERGG